MVVGAAVVVVAGGEVVGGAVAGGAVVGAGVGGVVGGVVVVCGKARPMTSPIDELELTDWPTGTL